jgi:uncharacterized protein with ParB-like and HNH nuclease domain
MRPSASTKSVPTLLKRIQISMSLSIRQLLDQIYNGQIRIPAFQRGFVWDMERVA